MDLPGAPDPGAAPVRRRDPAPEPGAYDSCPACGAAWRWVDLGAGLGRRLVTLPDPDRLRSWLGERRSERRPAPGPCRRWIARLRAALAPEPGADPVTGEPQPPRRS